MNDFELYLKQGLWHIADLAAYDHIVFVVALCIAYNLSEWRKLVWLITAFTVGHSLSLVMSVLNIVVLNTTIIELLIPITIMITSILNLSQTTNQPKTNYLLTLFFGLIHGYGFSTLLKSLLGSETSVWQSLLYFNIGIEIGQLLIVSIALLISYTVIQLFHVEQLKWKTFISGATFGIAFILLLNQLL